MKRLLLFCLMILPVALHAQNQLVPADDAVQLRRVWTQQGETFSDDQYGQNVAGIGDVNNDSIADFAVRVGVLGGWKIYFGSYPAPDTVVDRMIDSSGSTQPVIGDFWGDGRKGIVFPHWRIEYPNGIYTVYTIPSVYKLTEARVLPDTAVLRCDHRCFLDMQSAELDGEPGEELIVMRGCSVKEIWIYKGGANFQLDTPMVVISDTGLLGSPDQWLVRFADLDGDGRTDMLMGGSYPTGGRLLRFYFGDNDSPQSWTQRSPDRDVQLLNGQSGIASAFNLGLYRLDAHPGIDIVGYTGAEAEGTYVYLSSRGDPRTRSFLTGDADIAYLGTALATQNVGFLNDSLRRYEMIPVGATVGGDALAHAFVSGGADGPDHDYEAWYAPGNDGLDNAEYVFQRGAAVGDVTGDGFGDVLYSDWRYGAFTNTGIAFLLSGGPHIPLDDPSTVVEEYPVAGESSGLYLWPNPVDDELHIAWRGNLKRMPARFSIYDMSGARVVEGEVDQYRGEMIWRCDGVAAGAYLLIAYDTNDNPIADARITKR